MIPVVEDSRRSFLRKTGLGALGLGLSACSAREIAQPLEIMTVRGPIPADQMGMTLPHEHLIVDFMGSGPGPSDRYDQETAFRAILPHLERLKAAGCATLIENTPAYIGRDAAFLHRLSKASGLHILTNTGLYGAAEDKYLPPFVYDETPEELARRWLTEWTEGIGATGIRPGFIKSGADKGPLSEIDAKLVRAAALTHRKSGLAIAIHTSDAVGARDELRILKEEGVGPEAFVWIHAQNADSDVHVELARQGVWVSLDGINVANLDRYRDWVVNLWRENLLGRVLISHDDGWSVAEFNANDPFARLGDGNGLPFDTILSRFLPKLREAGMGPDEIHRLTVENPSEAFSIWLRPA